MAEKDKPEKSKLSKAEAAKLVRRNVAKLENGKPVLDKDGNPVAVEQAITEQEVMSYADYGDRVVVVTTSGEKLSASKK